MKNLKLILGLLLIVAGAVAFAFLPVVVGLTAASGFIVAGVDYNGRETTKLWVRPLNDRFLPMGIKIVETARAGSIKLTFLNKLAKVLMPYLAGWQGGDGGGLVQKEFALKEFKAECQYDRHTYNGLVQEQLVRKNGDNKIDDKMIVEARNYLFQDAVVDDIVRMWWLGDTTKLHIAAGTYRSGVAYVIGDPDQYYNQFDGVLTCLMAESAAYLTATVNQVYRFAFNETLTTDEVEEVGLLMTRNSTRALRKAVEKGQAKFYCTYDVINNYKDTLLSGETEQARKVLIDGVERPTLDGVPMFPIDIDEFLENDFAADFPKDFMILTGLDNFAIVISEANGFAATKYWFNEDENVERQRTQFEMGANFIEPQMTSIAYYCAGS